MYRHAKKERETSQKKIQRKDLFQRSIKTNECHFRWIKSMQFDVVFVLNGSGKPRKHKWKMTR